LRYFELRRELNRLPDLIYSIRDCIVQEALEMEDENGWKRFEKRLLALLARAGLVDLYGSGLRDVCECVLNGVHRVGLREEF
jgi:hypothetical protein